MTGMIQHICKLMTYGSFFPMKFNITTNFPFETPLYLNISNELTFHFLCLYIYMYLCFVNFLYFFIIVAISPI